MTTPLADELDAPPLAREVEAIVERFAFDGIDGPAHAALRVLLVPDIAAGLRALPVVEQLRADHTAEPWHGSDVAEICHTCRKAFPCDIAEAVAC